MRLDPDKMIESNSFISLPAEIICHLFGVWLDLKEIALVDSAFCNHKLRLALLETVYPVSMLQAEPLPLKATAVIAWMNKRRLRSNVLVIYGTPLPSCCSQYLEISNKFIKHVSIRDVRGVEASEVLRALSACRCIKSLTMECCQLVRTDLTQWWDPEQQSWLHLESVSFDVRIQLSAECEIAIGIIRAAWQTIQRLQLIFHPEHVLNELKDVITFSKLVALSFSSDVFRDEDLISILNKTPCLAHLNVGTCGQLTDTSGIYIAKSVSHLQTLDLSWCRFTNSTLTALATHRPETLRSLCVSCGKFIDLDGLQGVLQHCKMLRVLHTDDRIVNMHTKLTQHLTSLTVDVRGDALSMQHVQCLPHQTGCLQYVCFESRWLSYGKLDFSAYTPESMPFLHTINISSFPPPAPGVCPTLDALQVERPTLKITYDPLHNCCDVMKLPL